MADDFPWEGSDPRFLQILIDEMPVPLFYKDRRGVYRGCNQRFEAFMGLTREEMIGRSVFDIAPLELAEVYDARDRELFDQPGTQIYEAQVETRGGTRHSVLFHKSTFLGPQGEVAGLVGAILDVTEIREMERGLRERAERDELTGLLNRTGLRSRMHSEFARAERYQHPLSVLVVDVDDLASFNRRHGEVAGDRVLQGLARELGATLRTSDIAARLEADEFAVVLPETDIYNAARLAERLRQTVDLSPDWRDSRPDVALTVCVGVASYPLDGEAADAVLQVARQRVRQAKRNGSNQVVGRAPPEPGRIGSL